MPARDTLLFDRLYKVRPLLNKVRANTQAHYKSHQQVLVDEAMILLKGRITLEQYMPMKPTKRGYKAWCLCNSRNGLLYNIEIYAQPGKSLTSAHDSPDDG
jgi:hypothetical protein